MRISPARNLAVAAVGALAVSGLASVVAPSAAHAADAGVLLVSQADGADGSLRFDGADRLMRLTAEVLDPAAEVSFEYNISPTATDSSAGWTAIPLSVSRVGRYASVDWDAAGPRGTTLAGRTVALRAVSRVSNGEGLEPTVTFSRRNGVHIARESSATEAVSFRQAPFLGGGGAVQPGYFTQPYADSGETATRSRVSGTTSATSGTVAVSWRGDDGAFHGTTDAEVVPAPLKLPDTSFTTVSGGRFSTVLDLTDSDVADTGIVAFRGVRDSDEVWATPLYRQTISSVGSSVLSNRAGEDADVLLSVYDQQGAPVVGAEVRRRSDDSLVGYTDDVGRVSTTQADGVTENYYANATDDDPYVDTDGDRATGDITTTGYTPAPNSVQAVFADGDAFDNDEYADGDIYLQVLDQAGRPVGTGESVAYDLFHAGLAGPSDTLQIGTTDAEGRVAIPFDPGSRGEYVLDYRLGSDPDRNAAGLTHDTFVAGHAVLALTPRTGTAGAGGEIDYVGSMTVEGVPLPGRRVALRYTRGVEVVPGQVPDAVLVTEAGSGLRSTLTTDRSGQFYVTVDDRLENPAASEIGGRLAAQTLDSVASEDSTLDGNAQAATSSTTRFGDGTRGSVPVRLLGAGRGSRDDQLSVSAPASVARETVKVFRYEGSRLVLERTVVLNSQGDAPYIGVRDLNGVETTTYVVRLQASKRVLGTSSNRRVLS